MVKMTDRQKWRNEMIKRCIDNQITGNDILNNKQLTLQIGAFFISQTV